MIVVDIIVLLLTTWVGFKCIRELHRHFQVLPVKLFKWLFIYHTFFAFVYFMITKITPADAIAYYYGSHFSLTMGTSFIDSITFILSDILHLSFLSTFWVFHLMGFFWLPIMYIAIRENMVNSKRLLQIFHCVLFLPGLSYWTGFIGKDGLMMVGISIFMFSLNNLTKRKKWFFFGLFLMFMIRPHICVLALLSFGFSLLFHLRYFKSKFVLTIIFIGVISAPLVIVNVLNYLGIRLNNFSELFQLIDFFQNFQQRHLVYNLRGGSQVDIRQYSFPIKIFTFLYRPLFFDAKGLLMLASSVENFIYLILSGLIFHRYCLGFFFKRKSLFYTTNVFFIIFFTTFMSLIISNMGLANRVKIMVLFSLFSIVFISQSYNRWIVFKKKLALTHQN